MTLSNSNSTIDIEAEQAVLGAIFLDSQSLDTVRQILEPRDFSQVRHELIYKVMLYLDDKDKPIDAITVATHFQTRGRYADMGGMQYLTELAAAVPTAANVAYYARIVRSKAHRRRAIQLGGEITKLAQEGDFEDDEDFFAAVEDLVDGIRPQESGKMKSLLDLREKFFSHIKGKAEKLKTGFFRLFDEWTGGLFRGWLYIIAGRPSVGKTAKALQLALGIVKNNPDAGAVLLYSQEMEDVEIIERMVAIEAEVNYPRLINKGGPEGFTETEWQKINDAYRRIERYPIYVRDSAGVTIEEIRAEAKNIKKRHGKLAAILVDYLQIMDIPQRKNETRAQAIGRVTRTMKTMARRMKIVFIALSQLDRETDTEKPRLKHLRESGNIEQDADVVEFLWFNPEHNREKGKKIIDSIFAKGRNVGTNEFQLEFRWWYQKYVEIDKPKPEKVV